jgi:hypothetical protein
MTRRKISQNEIHGKITTKKKRFTHFWSRSLATNGSQVSAWSTACPCNCSWGPSITITRQGQPDNEKSRCWWLTYPSEKWWSSSVGIVNFPTEWKVIKFMFQTTNQLPCFFLKMEICPGKCMLTGIHRRLFYHILPYFSGDKSLPWSSGRSVRVRPAVGAWVKG